jgi:hypothetical protein
MDCVDENPTFHGLAAVLSPWQGLFADPAQPAEPSGSSPERIVTVRFEAPKAEAQTSHLVEAVKAAAELIGSLAWPTVFGILLVTQRRALSRLLEALVALVQSSTRIKFGDLIDVEVDRTVREAEYQPTPGREIPTEELEAAGRLGRFVTEAELPTVRAKMLQFAREYESARSSMEAGPERTRVMTSVIAKMRTLAIAATPLLAEFASWKDSPGARLAATAILQLTPKLEYLGWLVERMRNEQPFVFFHASVALLAMERRFGAVSGDELRSGIEQALTTVKSFKGGMPDQNTIETLELALSELGG